MLALLLFRPLATAWSDVSGLRKQLAKVGTPRQARLGPLPLDQSDHGTFEVCTVGKGPSDTGGPTSLTYNDEQ